MRLPTAKSTSACATYSTNRYANSAGCANARDTAPPAAPALAKKTKSEHDPSASPDGLRNRDVAGGVAVARSTVMSVAVGKTPKPEGAIRVATVNTPQVTAVAKIKLPTVTDDASPATAEIVSVSSVSVSVSVFFSSPRFAVRESPSRQSAGPSDDGRSRVPSGKSSHQSDTALSVRLVCVSNEPRTEPSAEPRGFLSRRLERSRSPPLEGSAGPPRKLVSGK